MPEQIKLGAKVKDKVTGLVGVTTGRAEYLHRGPEYGVERLDTDGRVVCTWLEQDRLEVVA